MLVFYQVLFLGLLGRYTLHSKDKGLPVSKIYKKKYNKFCKLLVLQNNVHEIADGVVKINNMIN